VLESGVAVVLLGGLRLQGGDGIEGIVRINHQTGVVLRRCPCHSSCHLRRPRSSRRGSSRLCGSRMKQSHPTSEGSKRWGESPSCRAEASRRLASPFQSSEGATEAIDNPAPSAAPHPTCGSPANSPSRAALIPSGFQSGLERLSPHRLHASFGPPMPVLHASVPDSFCLPPDLPELPARDNLLHSHAELEIVLRQLRLHLLHQRLIR